MEKKLRLRIKRGYLSVMGSDESYTAVQIWRGTDKIWQGDVVEKDGAPEKTDIELLMEAVIAEEGV